MANVKKRILNHFGLKVLSLVIAVVIWIVVANVDDYKTTKQITGINIEFINGEAITEKNKVYEVPEGTTVDVVVKGRRSVVENLSSEDFKAVADLAKMSVTNAVNVDVSAISSVIARDISISDSAKAVVVAVENKIQKQMPITIRVKSDVAEGYAIKNKTATPNLITVEGAESVVNTIEEVVVDVDVNGANHNLTANGVPAFLDHGGNYIDATKFEYDVDSVEVSIEVAQTKQLSVKVKAMGDVAEGFAIASTDYQPTSILVVGDAADLAKVEEIIIDDVDVSGCNKDLETSVVIADYLPSGITIADDTEEIMIKVIIEKLVEKTIHLDQNDINIVGKKEGYRYVLGSSLGYSILVRGLKDKIDNLTVTNMIPSIDVAGYGPGVYTFKLNMRDIAGVQVMDEIEVELEIISEE